MIARVMSQDMGFCKLPKPGSSGVPSRAEDLLPLRLGGGSRPSELDGERPQCVVRREEEDCAGRIHRGVFQLSNLMHVRQKQIMVVQNEQLLLLQRLNQTFYCAIMNNSL